MRYAAEAHTAAPTAQMHSAAAEVETATAAAAEVSPTTAAEVSASASASTTAAAERLRRQWRRNGRQRRQQDCANYKSLIFHEYLPELHRM
jgi:hypothetical protein